mmetsp:Transcript_106284/g.317608  ORF Transcript_106284/g.317608 Transcript_106284/m.317608 type:complete len:353 (+) Transcript_106284:100-1158(+)|eukprot:CAMPEP_0175203572 /NCGR_PEP_ID=MMETSP0093-20121207/11130_1 /TAXON_ID=311494 /ORGANISM="Alexandrium monilatum, Strain CCMP3105" /LENGTH=352 /DNA_ID=CAMNT_0016496637 /DNA_START=84 /DNA_END=1142 /DNA_ORIENTATION=-
MSAEIARVLVTGGTGFLGAYVIRDLRRRGSTVAILDVKEDTRILEQVLTAEDLSSLTSFYLDIADGAAVATAVLDFRPSLIIHLAGVQIPTVRADPALGAAVNVSGTVNVFEAARLLAEREGARPVPVAYASSGAVLGPSSDYAAGGALPAERDYHRPRTLYGVFKLCNEGTARLFWQDHGVASVGLRPLTIFGVGREVGLTSGPTKAVKAAVLGRRFMIEVSGVTAFHYVADVARMFVEAGMGTSKMPGAHVCGIKGHLVSYEDFLAEAAKSVPELAGLARIRPGAPDVPIHGDVDESPLQVLCGRTSMHMPLSEAVADMVQHFKSLQKEGRLHDKDLGGEPPPPAGVSKL